MTEYRSNSFKSRESDSNDADIKVEKVVNGSSKRKKKSGAQKVLDIFVPEDISDVRSYIIQDKIVPAVKDIILDTVRACLGVDNRGSGTSRVSANSRASYSRCYSDSRDSRSPRRAASAYYEYDDILYDNRGDAETVLQKMDEQVADYGRVRVADYYEFSGITGTSADNDYGWRDIRDARVVRTMDGYIIRLPRAMALNREDRYR